MGWALAPGCFRDFGALDCGVGWDVVIVIMMVLGIYGTGRALDSDSLSL